MSVRIASNISSLQSQRRLGEATSALGKVSEKLSSGLRINRAADDAAGLQIAEGLRSDSKVYGQAVRNVNDGLSLLNIAQGAVQELSNIVIRQAELAEQAMNGTYSNKQRLAMNAEANALVREYNRIVATTSFNGLNTLDGITNQLRVQLGYGTDGGIQIGVGNSMGFAAGDGRIENFIENNLDLNGLVSFDASDVNGDGILDLVSAQTNNLVVQIGNGDGTFRAASTYAVTDVNKLTLVDINNDGFLDIIANTVDGFSTLIANGDGTFKMARSFSSPDLSGNAYYGDVAASDINGDGFMDFLYADGDDLLQFLGNGDGSFRSGPVLYSGNAVAVQVVDLNQDGILDIVNGRSGDGSLHIHLGNGNGTFLAPRSYSGSDFSLGFAVADFNGDGVFDIASGDYNNQSVSILLGNANGTFRAGISTSLGSSWPAYLRVGDINGDGIPDIVASDVDTTNEVVTILGNGDGTFRDLSIFNPGASQYSGLILGDVNEDGIVDIIFGNNRVSFLSGVSDPSGRRNNRMEELDLTTKYGAGQALLSSKAALTRINNELGALGAMQSRLVVANQNLLTARENYDSARSQLVDADIARESATLVSTRINQQAATAVLAQANQQPALALRLLGSVS